MQNKINNKVSVPLASFLMMGGNDLCEADRGMTERNYYLFFNSVQIMFGDEAAEILQASVKQKDDGNFYYNGLTPSPKLDWFKMVAELSI
jgi:hypothetical protein